MSGPVGRVITLPPIYHFDLGQKVKAKNITTGEVYYGVVEKSLTISHGYIIKDEIGGKLLFFDGKELMADDR